MPSRMFLSEKSPNVLLSDYETLSLLFSARGVATMVTADRGGRTIETSSGAVLEFDEHGTLVWAGAWTS
jgi:hypothetical protein